MFDGALIVPREELEDRQEIQQEVIRENEKRRQEYIASHYPVAQQGLGFTAGFVDALDRANEL